MARKSRRRVPEILWRVYGSRATSLADTIIDLIPCQDLQAEECQCRFKCLWCSSDKEAFLIRPDDPIHYRKLIRRSFVVVQKQLAPLPDFSPISQWSQREIVERIIEMTSYECTGYNVICARYDKYDQSSYILDSLTSSAWELLLSRVGDDVMVHLLQHTSIFLPFLGKQYQQVTGPPLSDEKKEPLSVSITKRTRDEGDQPSKKKRSISSSSSAESPKVTSMVVISEIGEDIVQCQQASFKEQVNSSPKKRSRLYLKRRLKQKRVNLQAIHSEAPCANGNTLHRNTEAACRNLQNNHSVRSADSTKKVKTKRQPMFNMSETLSVLPAKHVLNTLKANCSDSKILMKLIFGDVNAWSTAPFHGKGNCIGASICLYHSLLKSLKSLIGKSKGRHLKNLLDKHCPAAPFEKEALNSINPNFQRYGGKNSDNHPHGSILKRHNKKTENGDYGGEGMKAYCTKTQVVSFIWAVCRSIVPEDMLGNNHQRRVLRRNIAWFVSRRRHERCSVKQLLHKVKPSDFSFFARKQICCMNEGEELHDKSIRSAQQKLCFKWISWLFVEIIKEMVSPNFHVTESQGGRQNVYYYRKCDWKILIDREIGKSLDGYAQVDKAEAERISGTAGLSKFRLLPKENGMRMLCNLSSSSSLYSLCDSHAVLKEIQLNEPEMLGCSVFDYDDVYRKLCPYLLSLRSRSGDVPPPLFFVVADVFKAFDSIDQDKLMRVMQCVLKDEYVLDRRALVCCGKRSHWVSDALVAFDTITRRSKFTSACPYRSLHQAVVDLGENRLLRKHELMLCLEKMVRNNVLQVGEKFYVQRTGIPQGHKLSSLLCCLYHGHLERKLIYQFLEESGRDSSSEDQNALPSFSLLRFIDDYLFVSTSRKQAERFFCRLQRGFPEYNCFMNGNKFCLNFQVEGKTECSSKRMHVGEDGISFIRWTGLLINTRTFEVQVDYTRYLSNHISSTFTVSWERKPVRHLRQKLCAFLAPKCHPLFFDSNINSRGVVRLNVYQIFLLSAMKFHCYAYELARFWKTHPFMYLKFITRSIRHMFRLIRRRMKGIDTGSRFRPVLRLCKTEVTWLGLHAFIQVLKKKQSRYRILLMTMESALAQHELSQDLSQDMAYAIDRSHSSSLWNFRY